MKACQIGGNTIKSPFFGRTIATLSFNVTVLSVHVYIAEVSGT